MEQRLGEFEQLLLFAMLRLGDQAYSARIQEEIAQQAGRQRSAGSIYTTLERLEERGCVRSWLGDPTPERGGRRKRFYELTPAGARALKASYERLQRMAAGALHELDELAKRS